MVRFLSFFGDKHSVQLGGAVGWGIGMNHNTGGSRFPVRMGGLVMNIDIGGFHYIDRGAVEDTGAADITELANGEERSVKGLYPVKFSSGWRQ